MKKTKKSRTSEFELQQDPKKLSVKQLVAISNRGKKGYISIYRKIAVYLFIKPLLHTKIKPNHITFLRIILTILAIAFVFIQENTTGYIISLIIFHFTIVLDKLDGPLARFTKQCTPLGKYLDVLMDHTVSSIIFYVLAGIMSFQSTQNWHYLLVSLIPIISSQISAYSRTSLIENDVEPKTKWQQYLFSDNLIFTMNVLTIGVIIQFFYSQAVVYALAFFFLHTIARLIIQIIFIVQKTNKNPFSIKRIKGYLILVITLGFWIIKDNNKYKKLKKHLEKNYKKDKTIKQVLAIIQN